MSLLFLPSKIILRPALRAFRSTRLQRYKIFDEMKKKKQLFLLLFLKYAFFPVESKFARHLSDYFHIYRRVVVFVVNG